ncbi:four helix bundle protein [Candidatus Peregrinibacteria bacterium]|nr:four helix bundle protein [Candidatus Peregrinibacteria bacterium]
MAVIKTFKEMTVWQKAHELVCHLYKATESFPRSETFALTSQMRRAAVSIPSNIVEGFQRNSGKDSVHFYNIAQGSLEELKYQILLAHDLQYISLEQYKVLHALTEDVGRLLNGWIKVQRR